MKLILLPCCLLVACKTMSSAADCYLSAQHYWSILQQRCYAVERADIQIVQPNAHIYAILSEDKQQAEVFAPNFRGLLDASKGGYRSADGRFALQYDGTAWHWRENTP